MVSFETPFRTPSAVEFDAAFLEGRPLAWVARDGSKPERPGGGGVDDSRGDAWVLHAGPEWSRAHLSRSPEDAGAALLEAFGARFGPLPPVGFQRAHLWRYARPLDRTGPGALYRAERRIGVCGDAWAGGRVEGALLSGRAVAGRILGQAPPEPSNPLGEGTAVDRGEIASGQLALGL
jgi:predicted NAD/FAD-dependent oxidoreductase